MEYKALAWDDQPQDYLNLLVSELADFNIKVEIENDIKKFLQRMKNESFDFIITDIMLDDKTNSISDPYRGFTNLTEIREVHPSIPVLILTQHGLKTYKLINDELCWVEDKSTDPAWLAIKVKEKLELLLKSIYNNKIAKASLFIGSADGEALNVARAIQQNLEPDIFASTWKDGVFESGKTILENLSIILKKYNSAVFVFHPSDEIKTNNERKFVVRDNVIFEFGMFVGKWGVDRTTIVLPKNNKLRILTDINGLVYETYDPPADKSLLRSALAPACENIKNRLLR